MAALLGTQYQNAAFLVVPPSSGAFSSRITWSPSQRAKSAADSPPPPPPTTTISLSRSKRPSAGTGAAEVRAGMAFWLMVSFPFKMVSSSFKQDGLLELSIWTLQPPTAGYLPCSLDVEAQDPIHHLGELRDAVVGHDLLPPSHMGVGPHQYAAALGHLPQARPVIVEVEHLAARADHEAGDLHTRACGDLLRRLFPGLTSHASEEGESALTHQVQRADGLSGVPQPAVGQPRSRPGGGVVVELGVMGVGGLGRPIGDHGRRVVALIELDAVAVELIVLEFYGLAQFLP